MKPFLLAGAFNAVMFASSGKAVFAVCSAIAIALSILYYRIGT